jgi:hypothetical protein
MATIMPITEDFQHFLAAVKDSFWAICMGRQMPRLTNE